MVARSLDNDIEQCRAFGLPDLSTVAEGLDVSDGRRIVERRLGPEADETVERPSQVPRAPARRREIPVDEDPPARTDDEVPRSQVVVRHHLVGSTRVTTFFAPHGTSGSDVSGLSPGKSAISRPTRRRPLLRATIDRGTTQSSRQSTTLPVDDEMDSDAQAATVRFPR